MVCWSGGMICVIDAERSGVAEIEVTLDLGGPDVAMVHIGWQ